VVRAAVETVTCLFSWHFVNFADMVLVLALVSTDEFTAFARPRADEWRMQALAETVAGDSHYSSFLTRTFTVSSSTTTLMSIPLWW
jgi:nitrogen fixation protein FixH